MNARTPHYIAGCKTDEDWQGLRTSLIDGADHTAWKVAYEDYLLSRLRLRYLEPIEVLQRKLHSQGEGFSIVSIQCTLIEFLESIFRGLKYRYLRGSEVLGQHEYSRSSELFADFLCKRSPFHEQFSQALAEDFYKNVRFGLLHEAQTKQGWRIWDQSHNHTIVDPSNRIIFRDNMQDALRACIDAYGQKLIVDTALQQAFIRKFDSLCE